METLTEAVAPVLPPLLRHREPWVLSLTAYNLPSSLHVKLRAVVDFGYGRLTFEKKVSQYSMVTDRSGHLLAREAKRLVQKIVQSHDSHFPRSTT